MSDFVNSLEPLKKVNMRLDVCCLIIRKTWPAFSTIQDECVMNQISWISSNHWGSRYEIGVAGLYVAGGEKHLCEMSWLQSLYTQLASLNTAQNSTERKPLCNNKHNPEEARRKVHSEISFRLLMHSCKLVLVIVQTSKISLPFFPVELAR